MKIFRKDGKTTRLDIGAGVVFHDWPAPCRVFPGRGHFAASVFRQVDRKRPQEPRYPVIRY